MRGLTRGAAVDWRFTIGVRAVQRILVAPCEIPGLAVSIERKAVLEICRTKVTLWSKKSHSIDRRWIPNWVPRIHAPGHFGISQALVFQWRASPTLEVPNRRQSYITRSYAKSQWGQWARHGGV